MIRFFIIFVFAFTAIRPNISWGQEGNAERVTSYQRIAAHDIRLANIGYRLSKTNAKSCPIKAHNMGWVLHDVAQYVDLDSAQKAFTFNAPISVLYVVKDGPAQVAGVRKGDGILSVYWRDIVTGQRIETLKVNDNHKQNSYARMAMFHDNYVAVLQRISEQRKSGQAAIIKIKRDEKILELPFDFNDICASQYILDARDKIGAGANGKYVRITLGLSAFATNDDEFAAAAAHELAHNILQHRLKKQSVQNKIAISSKLSGNKKIRRFEQEADRLSVWIMANAGFDIKAALIFHERLGTRKGRPLLSSATHNKWRKRIGFIKQEIGLLDKSPVDGQGYRPLPLSRIISQKN